MDAEGIRDITEPRIGNTHIRGVLFSWKNVSGFVDMLPMTSVESTFSLMGKWIAFEP